MAIVSVLVEPISAVVRPELAIVSSLGAHVAGQYVLVRLRDEGGEEGLGEASVTSVWSGETQTGTIALIEQVFRPLIVGADPFDSAWILPRLSQAAFGNSFARAAVEMALLDLQGKLLGVPVCKLLGGGATRTEGIRLKFVIGAVEPELAAERSGRMVQQGWTAIKVKIGRQPQVDIARVRAVRERIGAATWLSVDANGGYTVEQAVRVSRELERLDVALFEQPTRRGDHLAMAEVRQRSGIPIMADESLFTVQDALDLVRHRSADLFSIYPGKHGGIREAQAIARIAEAASIPCTIGSNLEREVATAAMAHLVASTPNIQCERYPGDLIGPLYFAESLSVPPLAYAVDRLALPTGSGLGVKLAAPTTAGNSA